MLPNNTLLQGRYQIIEQIGRGGMGAVYKATDIRLRTVVALKQTLVEGEPLRRAFEREAQLLAALRHSSLPRVSDHFVDPQGQFLVMEYIPGEDLGALLEQQKRPFDVADVLRWADQLLDVLAYLHTHEPPIIHRDIKPQNMKRTAGNNIILLDFGLAKGSAAQTRATSAGSIFGYTPHYAPLEQIHGTGTDPRSDLYSLGATLYHLITDQTPIDALSRAGAKVNDLPDPLAPANVVNPNVPAPVAAVLHQAMAQNANQRPPTAAAMRAQLQEAGKGIAPPNTSANTVLHIPAANPTLLHVPASDAPRMADSTPAYSPATTNTPTGVADARRGGSQPPRRRVLWALLIGVPVLLLIGAGVFAATGQAQLLFARPTTTIAPATSIAAIAPTAGVDPAATPALSSAQISATSDALINSAVNNTVVAQTTGTAIAAQQAAATVTAQAEAIQQTAAAATAQVVAIQQAIEQTASVATAQAATIQQTADRATAQAAEAAATAQVAAQQTADAKPTRPIPPTRTPGPTRTPRPTAVPDTAGQCRVSGGGNQIKGSCSPGAAVAGASGSCITGSVVARDGSAFDSFLVFIDTGGAPPEYRLERHNSSTFSQCGLSAGTWGVAVAAVNDQPMDGSEQGAHLVILRLSGADGEHFIVNFRQQ
jgi:serine/threonine protein kinase